MKKLNINDKVLVQITDYGWCWLYEKKGIDFIKRCVKSHKKVIDGVEYYELQLHQIIDLFGGRVHPSNKWPIKMEILIP